MMKLVKLPAAYAAGVSACGCGSSCCSSKNTDSDAIMMSHVKSGQHEAAPHEFVESKMEADQHHMDDLERVEHDKEMMHDDSEDPLSTEIPEEEWLACKDALDIQEADFDTIVGYVKEVPDEWKMNKDKVVDNEKTARAFIYHYWKEPEQEGEVKDKQVLIDELDHLVKIDLPKMREDIGGDNMDMGDFDGMDMPEMPGMEDMPENLDEL